MKKLLNKKGFTLMEMLIVVAIIVILVAVSIPTFTASLDDAKKATDDANLRAARAIANTNEMLEGWDDYATGTGDSKTYAEKLYYDVDQGKFVKTTEEADGVLLGDKGQSSDNDDKYIVVELNKTTGKMTKAPYWGN